MRYRVWSWDPAHSLWMEVARGNKRDMTDALDRKRRAAARLMPEARFTVTTVSTVPDGPPADLEIPA